MDRIGGVHPGFPDMHSTLFAFVEYKPHFIQVKEI